MLKKKDIDTVATELLALDCSERETRIYICCLQSGPVSVQEVARKLSFNRVTVHSACEQLIKKGILSQGRKGKKRVLLAEPPDVFQRLVEEKRRKLEATSKRIELVSDVLAKIQAPDEHTPSVEFYEDIDGFKRMLERTLEAKGEFLAVVNAGLFSDLVGHPYLLDYFARRSKKKIYSRLVFPNVEWARVITKRAKEFKTQVRILPEHTWPSGIFSWNNCLSIKSFNQNRITCTIIENPDIATFFRSVLFEIVWEQAEPVRL